MLESFSIELFFISLIILVVAIYGYDLWEDIRLGWSGWTFEKIKIMTDYDVELFIGTVRDNFV